MLGCHVDGGREDRLLPTCGSSAKPGNKNCKNGTVVPKLTLHGCAAMCAAQGFDRAGAEDGHECWCGHGTSDANTPSELCTAPCSGDASQMCGGFGALTLMNATCEHSWPQKPRPPLPADMSSVKSVAVIGQLGGCGAANSTACTAKVSMLGGYTAGRITGAGIQVVSVEEAFRARGFNTTWVEGVSATNGQTVENAAAGIASAVAAVIAADLSVVTVGCVGCTCCNRCGCGEAGDRQDFDLEGQQLAMLSAVLNASAVHSKQIAVVAICGRPVTFGEGNAILDRVPALISAFRPGEEGGNAIVDLITGEYNPSGRLAQNWLRSVGQIYSPANPWYQFKWGASAQALPTTT